MKLKSRRWPWILGCLSLLLASLLAYFLVDTVFNGAFVDWVENNFMITSEEYIPEAGRMGVVRSINWHWVKSFLLGALAANGLLWAAAVAATRALARRRKAREVTQDLAHKLWEAMLSNREASRIFSSDQQEIAAQVAEIKAQLQSREQALKDETNRKNDLVLYLAHDLKTPLASVLGYLDLLQEAKDLPPEQRQKYTGIAVKKAQRLEELTDELFEAARFNLADLSPQLETIDLSKLLEQEVFEFQPMLEGKKLSIQLDCPETLPLSCDPGMLQRVLDNLLRNGVSYSREGTALQVAARKDAGQVTLSVKNQGATIPPDKLERIFQQFYRLDPSRSTSGGWGLGLAIAKRIVEAHRGTIAAQSENGTTVFTVKLPL